MKSSIVICIIILIPILGISAQQPVVIKDDSLSFGKNILPCISVTIPECNYDKVTKDWIKEIQTGTKSKALVENNEISIFGANLKNLSPNPLNIYSEIQNLDSLLKLYVTIETKKDEYVNRMRNYAEYTKVSDFIKEFSKSHYLEVAKLQSDTEEKKLKELRKELSSLESERDKLQKSLATGKTTIQEENDNLAGMNNELTGLNESIPKQNSELAGMSEGDAKKEKANQIKTLEKKKKDILKSIETSESNIKKANAEIEKSNRELPVNEQKQEDLKKQITVQEGVFQKYFDKYNKIKTY